MYITLYSLMPFWVKRNDYTVIHRANRQKSLTENSLLHSAKTVIFLNFRVETSLTKLRYHGVSVMKDQTSKGFRHCQNYKWQLNGYVF